MSDAKRQAALADGMLEGERRVGGMILRPFTLGSLQAARRLGLKMFVEDDDGTEEEGDQSGREEREMVAFAWLQSAPLAEEVLPALRAGNEVAWEKIDEFAFTLDMDSFQEFANELERMGGRVDAAVVEVVPKDKGGDKDSPPGKS